MDSELNQPDLTENSPKIPVLCIHGARDSIVSYENSKRFVEKINKFKGNGQFLKLDGYKHLDLLNLFIGLGNEKTGDIMSFINRF